MTTRLYLGALLTALLLASAPVRASGDGANNDWGLNEYGGSVADRRITATGQPGILLASAPASLLYMSWRQLHGQAIGSAAAEALGLPCCGATAYEQATAVTAWVDARKAIPDAPPGTSRIETERPGPDHTSQPNCMDDAFRTATQTLADRARAHGDDPGSVRFWLQAQDAVFAACSTTAALPPLPDDAPAWLQADYRYQSAARLFYVAEYPAAAAAFAAIAEDAASPWSGIAGYVRMRALLRQAMATKLPADYQAARQAAEAIPATSPLHAGAAKLGDMAQLRGDPAAAAARLGTALGAAAIDAQAAADFKDLQSLDRSVAPDMLDWILTIKTGAAAPPDLPDDVDKPIGRAQAAEARRNTARAHATERYAATHDDAWLLAVLALSQPGEAIDGAWPAPDAPGYLSALYHRIRLVPGDPAATRAVLDTVLARTDLTGTTRNLFLAERMQVATGFDELARAAMRARVCTTDRNDCNSEAWGYFGAGDGLFDTADDTATAGLGDDARYLIDRMALGPRMALGRNAGLPAPVRLDLALTNYARAVLLHDDAAIDALCAQLQTLLPVMAREFARIPGAGRGPDRVFAEYLVFAKIPGLRTDLLDYTRPAGPIADFQGRWPNWIVLARPDPASIPPAPVLYDNAHYQVVDVPAGTDLGGGHVRIPDVVCKGLCGAGGFVPRPVPFLADTAARSTAERHLLPPPGEFEDPASYSGNRKAAFPAPFDVTPPRVPVPPGAVSVWDSILAYAAQHPQDPRVPEALHWIIHVGHFGVGNNHSGKRAFQLLQSRYPANPWAKANPIYFD